MKLFQFLLLTMMALTSAVEITTDSTVGRNLLSKARRLNPEEVGEDSRQLEQNNYYTSWMTKYSMKFDGCYSMPQFEREEGMRSMLLARFRMCPSSNCGSCPNSGEYIVEMRDFIEAYTEAKQELNEYACESQKETCEYQCENGMYNYNNQDGDGNNNYYNYNANGNNNNNNNNNNNQNNNNNNNDNNNQCYYTCMSDAGLSYCDNENNGGNGDMNMDELMECRPLGGEQGGGNQNNQYYGNSNYQQYYVGAYCTGKTGVFLGTFVDSGCSKFAPKGTFEKYMGYSLPTQNLVGTDCISCRAPDENNGNNNNNNNNNQNNNNNNNNNYYAEVLETCEKIYEDAGKCEKNLDTQYKNNGACELMHGTLQRLDSAWSKGKRPASFALAWFFGLSSFVLISYIAWLHMKIARRQQINLLPSLNGNSA